MREATATATVPASGTRSREKIRRAEFEELHFKWAEAFVTTTVSRRSGGITNATLAVVSR
jgi:hypothetical protein